MNSLKEIKNNNFLKIELRMELKPGAGSYETFKYFKLMETYVRRRFLGVTDFQCRKDIRTNEVEMSFFHCGYMQRSGDNNLELFFENLKTLTFD
jgi:hypothetical protein